MKSKILTSLEKALQQVAESHQIPSENLSLPVELERCKDPNHGDFASNVALKYSKIFGQNPRQLAEALLSVLPKIAGIEHWRIAGPGFINIKLSAASESAILAAIVAEKAQFGYQKAENPEKIHLEFVSANPTGPLHVGHGRGAAYGDSLARVLRANGHQVDCEYYVNDAGRQMDILALSVYWRYMELCGQTGEFPKGIYQGDYVVEIAKELKNQVGTSLYHSAENWTTSPPSDENARDSWIDASIAGLKNQLGEDYEQVFNAGLETEVNDIKDDLAAFGVTFQRWYSEKSLFSTGQVEKTLQVLAERGFIYQKDGALWFKASEFGDEKDRVVKRENGMTTYFASDIAYHFDKYQRGYDKMIDIFGADHHGYMARVKASLSALGLNPEKLEIALVQFAVLYQNGEKVQMSTRSGQFVTLRQLRQWVGDEAARFFYVMRKPEQHLDFDLDLAASYSKENPYFYVQYAHARTCSVLEKARAEGIDFSPEQGLEKRELLTVEEEKALLRQLARFPEVVCAAGEQFAPHLMINYLKELASAWHQFYDAGHKVLHENSDILRARLLLTTCVRQVLANGLTIIGITAKERM